jgi:hypothetical protein
VPCRHARRLDLGVSQLSQLAELLAFGCKLQLIDFSLLVQSLPLCLTLVTCGFLLRPVGVGTHARDLGAKALLFCGEIAGIDTCGLQLSALLAHLGFLPFEFAGRRCECALCLCICAIEIPYRLARLLDAPLQLIYAPPRLEVGSAGSLGGRLSFLQCIDLP